MGRIRAVDGDDEAADDVDKTDDPVQAAANAVSQNSRKFSVRQKIEANFGGQGKWYKGSIGSVNEDGTYNIGYDDGDHEENVPEDRIRELSADFNKILGYDSS